MNTTNVILGCVLLAIAAVLVHRSTAKRQRLNAEKTEALFAGVLPLFSDTSSAPGTAVGTWLVSGHYQGQRFQLRSIIDTLATRKLPSLWLQVTLQAPLPAIPTLDVMLRAAGLASFSNFDFLPETLATPAEAPPEAVFKTDNATHATALLDRLPPHYSLLRVPRAKELLIAPTGVRLVMQLAEAGRLRYGVFRQADFETVALAPEQLLPVLNGLLALARDLRNE